MTLLLTIGLVLVYSTLITTQYINDAGNAQMTSVITAVTVMVPKSLIRSTGRQ